MVEYDLMPPTALPPGTCAVLPTPQQARIEREEPKP